GPLTQSPVALAISSPIFLGERPRGPILGASAEEAPTSPPVARRWLHDCQWAGKKRLALVRCGSTDMTLTSLVSYLGGVQKVHVRTFHQSQLYGRFHNLRIFPVHLATCCSIEKGSGLMDGFWEMCGTVYFAGW